MSKCFRERTRISREHVFLCTVDQASVSQKLVDGTWYYYLTTRGYKDVMQGMKGLFRPNMSYYFLRESGNPPMMTMFYNNTNDIDCIGYSRIIFIFHSYCIRCEVT